MQGRSTFVTAVGWISVVIAALGVLYCLMFLLLPSDQLTNMVKEQQAAMPQGAPMPDAATLVSVMRGVILVMLALLVWVVLSGVGLAKRKPWARVSFVVLMVLGMAVAGLYVLIALAGSSMPGLAGAAAGRLVAMGLVGAACAVLFAFTLYKLNTAQVKQEFLPPSKN